MRRFFTPLVFIASTAAPALALRCPPEDRACLELSARLRNPSVVPGRVTSTPAETARALEETTSRLRSRNGQPAGAEDHELAGQVLYYADLMKRQLDAERDALRGDTGGAADYLRSFADRITNDLGGNSTGMTLDQLRSYLAEQTRTAADAGRFVARQIEKSKTPPPEETPPAEEKPEGAVPARPSPPGSPAPDGAPEPETWTPPPPGEEGGDDEQDAREEEKSRKADEARRRSGENAAASRRRTESRMKDGAALLQDMATDAGGAPSGGAAANDSGGELVARGPGAPGSRGAPGDGTRPAPPPPGTPAAPDGAPPPAPEGPAGEAERRLDDFLVKSGLAGGASGIPSVVRAQAEREARLVRGAGGGFVNGADARRAPDERFDAYLASVKKHLAVYEFALKKFDPANPAFKDIVLDSSARAALLRWGRTCVPADAACSRVAGLAGLLRYRSGEPVPMSVIAKLVAELSDKTLAGTAARGGKAGGMPEHRRPSALKAMLKALGIGGDGADEPPASPAVEGGGVARADAGAGSYTASAREPLELSDPARRRAPGAPPAPDEAKLPWWKRLWRWLKGLFLPAAKP